MMGNTLFLPGFPKALQQVQDLRHVPFPKIKKNCGIVQTILRY